jgi:hypothetical protein
MIAYLIKNWKLLLDIIIVVGGIIVFTLFDPFGMFSKRELKGTANLVSSIKDIGELVTAEYYGEVISSLNETFVFDIPEDTVSEKFEECLYRLKLECKNAIDNRDGVRKFVSGQKLANLRDEYNKNNEFIYNHLIVLLAVNLINPDEDKFYKENEQGLQGKTEQRVIRRIFNEIEAIHKKHKKNSSSEEREAELNHYINDIPIYLASAASFHYQLNKMALSNKERRRDIVFIGRGWVKAGYQFEKLDERNFAYDKNRKLIRFYGLSPVILDKDINPWFIPENKIQGFELVDFYKKATFEEAKIVKIRCKEKLLEQANHSGIMKQAQKNGEEALKNFFSLLLDEPDLKVEFQPLPFQNELNLIGADTLVTVQEALMVDSVFTHFANKIDKAKNASTGDFYRQQLLIFYNQLQRLHFIDSSNQFNMFSTEAAKVLTHKYFVVKADYDQLRMLRDTLRNSEKLDTIFTRFTKKSHIPVFYPEFVLQFNEMLSLIDDQLELAIADTNITVEITKQQKEKLVLKMDTLDGLHFIPSDKRVNDDTVFILRRDLRTLPYRFMDLSYPELFIPDSLSMNIKISKIDSIEPYINRRIKTLKLASGDSIMNSLRLHELNMVLKPYEINRIRTEVSLKPIHKFIDFVKNPLN